MVDVGLPELGAATSILAGFILVVMATGLVSAGSVASVADGEDISVSSDFENPFTGPTTFAFVDTNQEAAWTVSITNNGDKKWREATATLVMGKPTVTGTTTVGDQDVFTCFSENVQGEISNSPSCREDIVNDWNLKYKLPEDEEWQTPTGSTSAKVVLPRDIQSGDTVKVDYKITVPQDWDKEQRKMLGNVLAVDSDGSIVRTSFTENVNPSPQEQAKTGNITGSTLQLGSGVFLIVIGIGFFLTREL